jgi:small-conductance mechanosensitive channel
MSTWQPRNDEFRPRLDEHEARLEAQGYAEWMRERQRHESLEHQLRALFEEVRQLHDEVGGLERTVESLLERDAEPGGPQHGGDIVDVELDDGSIFRIPL